MIIKLPNVTEFGTGTWIEISKEKSKVLNKTNNIDICIMIISTFQILVIKAEYSTHGNGTCYWEKNKLRLAPNLLLIQKF